MKIKAMLKMAKLLYSNGIFITFVNTEFNHRRLLKSEGAQSLNGLPGFKFETLPDGLHASESDTTQDTREQNNKMVSPFKNLLIELNAGIHQVTSILSDGFMSFAADVALSLGIPVKLWTVAACGFMGIFQFKSALQRDESYLTNGYLDTIIDWIPGMRNIRLGELPSHIRAMDPNDVLFIFLIESAQRATNSTGHVFHTFDDLEQEVLNAISSMFRCVYTIGPQQFPIPLNHQERLKNIGCSLWEEDRTCLQWLDSKEADSVVYINFGSLIVMSPEQLMEFGWGIANSNCSFLWTIRPDLIVGESAITLGVEFMDAIKNRGIIASWCPQENVLNHESVEGFLTHGGWNSIIKSISAGVPMLCWPFFGDQTTNCKYICNEWGCGMEIRNDVKRDDVEKLVRLLMNGVEGKKLRKKAMEWRKMAEKACGPDGSSSLNLEKLVLHLKN